MEALARAPLPLRGQEGQQVVAVDVHLERLVAGLVSLLQLLDDVRLACRRQERRQPVVMLDDVVDHDAGRNLPRPAHEQRNAECPLPIRVLLVPERKVEGSDTSLLCRDGILQRMDLRDVVGIVWIDKRADAQQDVPRRMSRSTVLLTVFRGGADNSLRDGRRFP